MRVKTPHSEAEDHITCVHTVPLCMISGIKAFVEDLKPAILVSAVVSALQQLVLTQGLCNLAEACWQAGMLNGQSAL